MRKLYQISILLVFALLYFISCKKNTQDVLSSQIEQSKFSIAEAKAWYSSSVNSKSGKISSARTDTAKNRVGKFTPLWDKAINTEDDKYHVVECPLRFDTALGYSVKTGSKSPAVPINGSTQLLILKNKKTGEMISALMHIYSSTGSGAEKIHYGKTDEKFSGLIFFTDTEGNFVNASKYENGKLVGKSKNGVLISKDKHKALPPDDGGSCTTHWTATYGRWCWYDEFGNASSCGPWELDSYYSITVCSGGGGGGGGGGGYADTVKYDCANVANGTAYLGQCGICVGGTTGFISCDDPCAQQQALTNMANDSILVIKNNQVLSNTNSSGKEYGYEENLQVLPASNQSINYNFVTTSVRTNNSTNTFTPNFSWNSTNGYTIGVAHGHPTGGTSPSPADAVWAVGNLSSVPEVNQQFYKHNVSVSMLSSTGNYFVTPQNWSSLETKYNDYNNAFYQDTNGNYKNHMNEDFISIAQNYISAHGATPEEASEFALMTIMGDAINLYKAPAGTTTFTPLEINTNSMVGEYPCR